MRRPAHFFDLGGTLLALDGHNEIAHDEHGHVTILPGVRLLRVRHPRTTRVGGIPPDADRPPPAGRLGRSGVPILIVRPAPTCRQAVRR
jgi:hypothetical protein